MNQQLGYTSLPYQQFAIAIYTVASYHLPINYIVKYPDAKRQQLIKNEELSS